MGRIPRANHSRPQVVRPRHPRAAAARALPRGGRIIPLTHVTIQNMHQFIPGALRPISEPRSPTHNHGAKERGSEAASPTCDKKRSVDQTGHDANGCDGGCSRPGPQANARATTSWRSDALMTARSKALRGVANESHHRDTVEAMRPRRSRSRRTVSRMKWTTCCGFVEPSGGSGAPWPTEPLAPSSRAMRKCSPGAHGMPLAKELGCDGWIRAQDERGSASKRQLREARVCLFSKT